MKISGISSSTSGYAKNIAPDGDSATAEANESKATKLAEQQNGQVAPQAPSTGKQPAKSNDLARLRMFANQHLSAGQIAQRLGKSVSNVMQEAAAAGISLSSGSSSGNSSYAKTGGTAI